MKKVKFGIIGCSSFSKKTTIPSMLKSKYLKLEIIGSRSKKKAKRFAIEFSCKKYGDYDEVLENPNVDAVYISLPTSLQEEWVIKSAKAQKHVICEKSATISYHSAKKMVKDCKKNNVRLMEGFSFRFHPQHNKVLNIIKQNKIGKPLCFFGRYGFTLPYSSHNFRFNKKLGGGSLNDVGCYLICASRMIFNEEPVSVGCKLCYNKHSEGDVNGIILLNYSHNKTAFGLFGHDLFFQSIYTVLGKKGNISLKRAFNITKDMCAHIILNSEDIEKKIRLVPSNQSLLMIDSFCNGLAYPNSTPFNFENDLLVQAKVMEASRQSYSQNKPISLTSIK